MNWFDPNCPATSARNLRAWKPDTPMLWVAGDGERMPTAHYRPPAEAAPANPKSGS